MSAYAESAPLPRHLQLEVTSACNLRCRMCLVRYRPPVNKADGAMPMATFLRLLDEVPGLERLTLQGLGEPLLSPYLLDMVAAAKERGIAVGFNSNATLLTRAVSERLVGLGLDWLHVSVDGASADTYSYVRDGADLDRVLRNLADLAAAKAAAQQDLPWVRVVFVAMQCNVGELPDLVTRVADCGVDEVRVQNLSHSFDDTDPAGSYDEIRRFAATEALWGGEAPADGAAEAAVVAFAAAERVAAERGVRLRLPALDAVAVGVGPGEPGCTWPWDAAYVTSAGVVQPCCMVMGDDRVALGRVADEGFATAWNGPAYRDFRRRLLGDEPPEVCRGCSAYRGVF